MRLVADLRSDTVTQPTPAMRRAMAIARVGDDCYGEDPTVNALQREAARRLGFAGALFVPTGVMANQIAIAAHTQPGDEIVVDEQSHIANYELSGSSFHAHVLTRTVRAPRGILTPALVDPVVRPRDWHASGTGLICIENTHNCAGGTVWPLASLAALSRYARARKIPVHLDGARVFNAAAALGVPVRTIARYADSAMFCLSKGLCAPVGSLLLGSREFLARARTHRLRLGGSMRQAGVLAAAGRVALSEMRARLPDDHRKARWLADALARVPGVRVEPESVETNIVVFESHGAGRSGLAFARALGRAGVRISWFDERRLRIVTHRDVTWPQVRAVAGVLGRFR